MKHVATLISVLEDPKMDISMTIQHDLVGDFGDNVLIRVSMREVHNNTTIVTTHQAGGVPAPSKKNRAGV